MSEQYIIGTNFDLNFLDFLESEPFFSKCKFVSADELVNDVELNRRCNVFLATIEFTLTESYLRQFQSLKFIISPATGLTHIDQDYLKKRNIGLISLYTRGDITERITSSSEHAWGLFLALHRGIMMAERKKHWSREFRNFYWSNQISNLTICVVGYGRIGRQIAKYAQCFGAELIVVERERNKGHGNVKLLSLDDALPKSDVVFIAASVDTNVRESLILDTARIQLLKPSTLVINVARGCLVNERSLLEALREGKIRGYATDVLGKDDIGSRPNSTVNFQQIENAISESLNLIVTPHIAGASLDAIQMIVRILLLELLDEFSNMKESE